MLTIHDRSKQTKYDFPEGKVIHYKSGKWDFMLKNRVENRKLRNPNLHVDFVLVYRDTEIYESKFYDIPKMGSKLTVFYNGHEEFYSEGIYDTYVNGELIPDLIFKPKIKKEEEQVEEQNDTLIFVISIITIILVVFICICFVAAKKYRNSLPY